MNAFNKTRPALGWLLPAIVISLHSVGCDRKKPPPSTSAGPQPRASSATADPRRAKDPSPASDQPTRPTVPVPIEFTVTTVEVTKQGLRSAAIDSGQPDGWREIIAASTAQGRLEGFRHESSGGFTRAWAIDLGGLLVGVTSGDLNHDGLMDLVATDVEKNEVAVCLAAQSGGVAPPQRYAVEDTPWEVAIGNFNDDAHPDIVTINQDSGTVSVLLGQGNGKCARANHIQAGPEPFALAVDDVNGDGKTDCVVACQSGLSVLLGKGHGGFEAARLVPVAGTIKVDQVTAEFRGIPMGISIADANGDGIKDFFVTHGSGGQRMIDHLLDGVSLLLGDGQGGWAPALPLDIMSSPTCVAVADFNKDGRLDVAVANTYSLQNPPKSCVTVLANMGSGRFERMGQHEVGDKPVTMSTGDIDGNGFPDLVVVNMRSGSLSVVLCKPR